MRSVVGSKYIEFESRSRILAQLESESRVMVHILKRMLENSFARQKLFYIKNNFFEKTMNTKIMAMEDIFAQLGP